MIYFYFGRSLKNGLELSHLCCQKWLNFFYRIVDNRSLGVIFLYCRYHTTTLGILLWSTWNSQIFTFIYQWYWFKNEKRLVWPQWWSFADVSQQGLDFSKKISKRKIFFWFDFHRCSHGLSKSAQIWLSKSFSYVKKRPNYS